MSLVGTWTGQRDRIAKIEGRRGGLATLVITEQQGNTFVGRLKRANATGDEEEPLWGAFTPGGKLMIGSDEEGTYIFGLIDQNTLDYCYSETGRFSAIRVRKTDPSALTRTVSAIVPALGVRSETTSRCKRSETLNAGGTRGKGVRTSGSGHEML